MTISACNKQWHNGSWDRKKAAQVAQQFSIPIVIAAILLQRGISEPEKIREFLNPSLDQLPSPFLMKGMAEGVDLLITAVNNKVPVIIYGDYDVDGTTGTAVLAHFFNHLDTPTYCYQPDRLVDGYGLHNHLLDRIHQEVLSSRSSTQGILVTVDCGISDCAQITYAKNLGFQVIVTDHHQPPLELPPADVIINPWQPGCEFPFKELAGAGVAFYLTMGLRSRLVTNGFWSSEKVPVLKQILDLVAVGTIADMMPLTDINRVLVKAGLEVLQTTKNKGLKALLELCGLQGKKIYAEDIAFQIAPRLNAPGRILGPGLALDLLLTTCTDTAKKLAKKIDAANQSRRTQGDAMFEEGLELAQKQIDANRKSIVVTGENWHPGLIGIAATKIAKHYYRPTIVISKTNSIYRGSGRSIPGCNLYDIINDCQHLLESHGGHESAIGLSIKPENLDNFIEQFESAVQMHPPKEQTIEIDWHFEKTDNLNENLKQWINLLEPFGQGNPRPILSISLDTVNNGRIVGANHLKFTITLEHNTINGIGFQLGNLLPLINGKTNSESFLAFTLKHNSFQGKEEWQAQATDFLVSSHPTY